MVLLLTSRTKLLERRRRCGGSSSLNKIAHSWVLNRRYRKSLLSRVSSLMLLLQAVRGRSKAKIRGYTRRRRSTLHSRSSKAGVRRSRKQYKVYFLVGRKVQSCCGEPRGLRLGKPSLMMIRDERLRIV